MSLKDMSSESEHFKMALFFDDALDMTREEYDEYLKTCDESQLKLKAGERPSFLLIKKFLTSKQTAAVETAQVHYIDGVGQPALGFMVEEARFSIDGIEHPPGMEGGLQFKKENGGCGEKLLSYLISKNVHRDIWQARQHICQGKTADKKK